MRGILVIENMNFIKKNELVSYQYMLMINAKFVM